MTEMESSSQTAGADSCNSPLYPSQSTYIDHDDFAVWQDEYRGRDERLYNLILACNLETKNKLDSLDTNTAKIIALQCEVNAKTQIIHDLIIERKDTKNLFVVGILSGIVIAGVGVAFTSITPILLGVVLAATAFGGIWGIRKDGR